MCGGIFHIFNNIMKLIWNNEQISKYIRIHFFHLLTTLKDNIKLGEMVVLFIRILILKVISVVISILLHRSLVFMLLYLNKFTKSVFFFITSGHPKPTSKLIQIKENFGLSWERVKKLYPCCIFLLCNDEIIDFQQYF